MWPRSSLIALILVVSLPAAGGPVAVERVRIEAGLAARLAALGPEESLFVSRWPIAPGQTAPVTLTRHEVYAAGARLYRVGPEGVTEVPRSRLVFYWGASEDGRGGAMVSLDPETGELRGLSLANGAEPVDVRSGADEGELLVSTAAPEGVEPAEPFACEEVPSPRALRRAVPAPPAPALASLHAMTVAIDTDNELMAQKFGDNVTTATNYVASLIAAINVFYERDIKLRLVQGTSYYRISSQPDPYVQSSGGNASSAELTEFGNHWLATYGGVTRGLAALLSGKQPSANSASGIAWVDALCDLGFGYSFSKVFKVDYLAGDTRIVGHEIGHNLASPHTHCYTPPADTCYNLQGGCYAGATSCPPPDGNGDRGTLMSYCHILGGCSASLVFHARTMSEYVNPALALAVGTCVLPASGATPSITPAGVSRARGASASTSTVATVTDADTPAGNLTVSLVSAPAGITVTSLVNAAGTVSASVSASCTAALGGNNVTLRVSDGATTADGTLVVNVTPDATPPAVTPPAATTVEQTLCSGGPAATPATSSALTNFVNGGSATDTCTNPPTRLTAQVGGGNVSTGTVFPAGATIVTFRYQDGAGNIGTATSQVTVRRRGDVDGNGAVDVLDVVTLASAIVGNVLVGVSPYLGTLTTGDANNDLTLSVTDLQLVQARIVGNTPCLPAP